LKQVVVLSGKGGTGKTSITAALAHLARKEHRMVLADADVDAANLEILLESEIRRMTPFIGGYKAVISPELCSGCGRCLEVCRFGAVVRSEEGSEFSIDAIACEGCNSCVNQCPEGAIESVKPVAGTWFESDTPLGKLIHAQMRAGQENSGKLVTVVKNEAIRQCTQNGQDLLLVDGPPGIGCPVIAACAGADLALIATEPGVSAIHDLARILETVEHFGLRAAVCVNRADINPGRTEEIVEYCGERDVPVLGVIPYDRRLIQSMSVRQSVIEYDPCSPASAALTGIWESLQSHLWDN